MNAYLDTAIDFYGRGRGREAPTVETIARRVSRTFATRAPASPKIGISPAPTAGIGKLLALEVMGRDGTLYEHRWITGFPPLFWIPQKRAILALPGALGRSTPLVPGEAAAKRASAEWNARWGVRGARRRTAHDARGARGFRFQGAAVRIVYRSQHGVRDDWQHYFKSGVRVWVAPGFPPAAFYIRGGNLQLTRRGLIN